MNAWMRGWLLAGGVCWLGCLAADAVEVGHVEVHGFGGWAYGKTDNENRYLTGSDEGNYDNVNFSLNLIATPYEHLGIYAQPSFTESFGENEIGLDYAFADWFARDELRVRAGKVKAPFLLYSEVYDVGTIRPFFELPPSIYQQLAPEAYKGIGVTGTHFFENGWGCSYDAYFGELELMPQQFIFLEPEPRLFEFSPKIQDLFGGRFMVQPPVAGLNFGVSFYRGRGLLTRESSEENVGQLIDHYLFLGASLEYLSDTWWVRSEYLAQHESDAVIFDSVYIEPAYMLGEHWQVAARYEWMSMEVVDAVVSLTPDSFFEHQSAAVGVNYWINPNFVLKAAYHIANGNRCARPSELADLIAAFQQGAFEEETNLLSLGVQFSF